MLSFHMSTVKKDLGLDIKTINKNTHCILKWHEIAGSKEPILDQFTDAYAHHQGPF